MSTELPPSLDSNSQPSPYGPVTAPMVSHLHATRPWLLFLAIIGFLVTALVAVMAVFMGIMGAAIFSSNGEMSESAGMVVGLVAGLVYMLVAVIYGFWSYLLLSNANAISAMKGAMSVPDLTAAMELALDRQRRFWKVTGIAVIVSMVAYIGLIVAVMIAAVVAATAGGASST